MRRRVDALQIGLKIGKQLHYSQETQQPYGNGFTLDNDHCKLSLKMEWLTANGELDLNYSGNFDALGIRFQMTNSTYFGLQRTFLIEEKLRVGVTYHLNNYIAGAQLSG